MSVVAVLLTLAVVVLAAVLALLFGRRHFRNEAAFPPPGSWPEEAHPSESTASSRLDELEALRRRGEIDVAEYEVRRRDLLG